MAKTFSDYVENELLEKFSEHEEYLDVERGSAHGSQKFTITVLDTHDDPKALAAAIRAEAKTYYESMVTTENGKYSVRIVNSP